MTNKSDHTFSNDYIKIMLEKGLNKYELFVQIYLKSCMPRGDHFVSDLLQKCFVGCALVIHFASIIGWVTRRASTLGQSVGLFLQV